MSCAARSRGALQQSFHSAACRSNRGLPPISNRAYRRFAGLLAGAGPPAPVRASGRRISCSSTTSEFFMGAPPFRRPAPTPFRRLLSHRDSVYSETALLRRRMLDRGAVLTVADEFSRSIPGAGPWLFRESVSMAEHALQAAHFARIAAAPRR